jgi:hypothetical protein
MPRGGPGSAAPRKLPTGWPRTDPYLVWSYFDGAWWRVAGALSLHDAQVIAANRLLNVLNGTHGSRALGTAGIKPRPDARFAATARDGDPQTQWEAMHELDVP